MFKFYNLMEPKSMMKKHTSLRMICTLLLCTMLVSFVSCTGPVPGGDGEKTPTSTGGNVTSAPITTEPVTTEMEYVAPDVFYDSADYTILVTGNPAGTAANPFAYSDTQLVLDNAVYMRNIAVEEELGITLNVIYETASNNEGNGPGTKKLQADSTAGESNYDSCLIAAYDLGVLAQQGMLADLSKVSHIDLDMDYWDQNAKDQLAINNKLFFTTGDISYNDKEYTFAVLFNKTIAKEEALGNLYDLVREGKWTFDTFAEMARKVTVDLNGDDIMDSRDKYGLELWDDTILYMVTGAGQKILTLDEDGVPELTLNTEITANIVEKYIKLASESCSINFQHMSGGVSWINMYINGQALFLLEYFKALPSFRDTDLDYGLLPFPKYDEAQESHQSGMSAWHVSFYCIPDLSDLEYSGIVSESLAYHSERLVTPAYYERNLVGRQIKDLESADMLDIIFDNRTYDLGLYYRTGDLSSMLLNMLRTGNTAFASRYQAYHPRAEHQLKELKQSFNIE